MHVDFNLLNLSWPNIPNIAVGNRNVGTCYWANKWKRMVSSCSLGFPVANDKFEMFIRWLGADNGPTMAQ